MSAVLSSPPSEAIRLVVNTPGGVVLLCPDEIEFLASDGNYIVVQTSDDKSYRIRLGLAKLFAGLRSHGFLRIHRGTVVRATAIASIDKAAYRKAHVVLRSGARLEIGRAYFHGLRELWHPGLVSLGQAAAVSPARSVEPDRLALVSA